MHFIISDIICHVRWYQIFPDITLNFVSYLYLFDYQYTVFVKIRAYKTSNWVFILHGTKCYTHNYIKHHLPRQMISIICHVSWYQIFPDTTLNFVSYTYHFEYQHTVIVKFAHIKRVAVYIFCTGRTIILIIISSIICHVRWCQISRFISSVTCIFWLSISFFWSKFVHI